MDSYAVCHKCHAHLWGDDTCRHCGTSVAINPVLHVIAAAHEAGRMNFLVPEADTSFWESLVNGLRQYAYEVSVDWDQMLEFLCRLSMTQAADSEWSKWWGEQPEIPDHELAVA